MNQTKQPTQVEELYRYAKRCADSTMPDEAAIFALAAETIESQQAEIERLRALNLSSQLEQAIEFAGCIALHTQQEAEIVKSGFVLLGLQSARFDIQKATYRLNEALERVGEIEGNEHVAHFADMSATWTRATLKMLEG